MQIPSPQIRYLPSARRAMRPGQSCAGFRPVLSAPAGVRVCLLSEGPTQASHLQGKYPGTGEAGSSAYADKKDGHRVGKIHYNKAHHEYTPRGRGASKDCLPKLPRWPFSLCYLGSLLAISPGDTSFALIEGIKKAPTEAACNRSASVSACKA